MYDIISKPITAKNSLKLDKKNWYYIFTLV